jgi:hypothetical protein
MAEFILMLTRDDVTVPNALELADVVLETEVRHIGFKDIGLDQGQMRSLVDKLHAAGRIVHLEVVSLNEDDELRSAEVGLGLGVDYLIGGTSWHRVADLIAGSALRYFPYPGRIVGHPAVLAGEPEAIIADAQTMSERADGVNLLAYRHQSIDGAELLTRVAASVAKPIIAAGSIDSLARVRAVSSSAWAFTIGAAALDRRIVPGAPLAAQIEHVLAEAA